MTQSCFIHFLSMLTLILVGLISIRVFFGVLGD